VEYWNIDCSLLLTLLIASAREVSHLGL